MQAARLITVFWLCVFSAQTAFAAGLEGVWRTENGESHIEITPCTSGHCGKIIYLAEPFDQHGRPKTDEDNPDPEKRLLPILGLTIVFDMVPNEGPNHWRGKIYNPDDGDTYQATIALREDELTVEGCVALIICGSQVWTRMR